MPSTTSPTAPQPRPVRFAGAIIATVYGIAGGVLTVPGLPDPEWLAPTVGLVLLVCTVLTATAIPILEGRVSPWSQVLQQYDASGQVILGPAEVDTIDDDQLGHAEATDAGDDEPGDHRPEVVGTDGEPYYEQP